MARDISTRLNALKARRSGTDGLSRVAALDAKSDILRKSFLSQRYEGRAPGKKHTQYALGAMEQVDAEYTRISLETATRVGRHLERALAEAGMPVHFRLQGSVPLNIHIRGVSDVDLLTLDSDFFTYDVIGLHSQLGLYTNPTSKTSVGVLHAIRREAEQTLRNKYPAADIDTGGGKAIKISGGSLARPVDVIPAHWHDTAKYQEGHRDHDRAVTILDKKIMRTLHNFPFLHIALVDARDMETAGSLKKAIRLCKNVRNDADYEIDLPSFDIAAIMYHADRDALWMGGAHELDILAETQRHLDYLYRNQAYAKTLQVPDGSRLIFDSEAKMTALLSLSCEMDDLIRQVAKEQSVRLALQERPLLAESRSAISSVSLP